MKVEHKKQGAGYEEHSITLTFTNRKEAEAIFCIFNYTDISEFLAESGIDSGIIRDQIRESSDCTIDYENKFKRLTDIFKLSHWSRKL